MLAQRTNDTNVNKPSLTHHKEWSPSEIQAAPCYAYRSNIHSPSSHFETQRHNSHRRCCHHPSGDYMAIVQFASSVTMRIHGHTSTCRYRENVPICLDSFIIISSGHLICAPHFYLAEFLCRRSLHIFAANQSNAEKCREHMPRAVSQR